MCLKWGLLQTAFWAAINAQEGMLSLTMHEYREVIGHAVQGSNGNKNGKQGSTIEKTTQKYQQHHVC